MLGNLSRLALWKGRSTFKNKKRILCQTLDLNFPIKISHWLPVLIRNCIWLWVMKEQKILAYKIKELFYVVKNVEIDF